VEQATGRYYAKEQLTVMTRKGQITVPADIRRALGLQVGDKVAVSLDEEGQILHANLRPVRSVADATFGSIRSAQQPISEQEVRQAPISTMQGTFLDTNIFLRHLLNDVPLPAYPHRPAPPHRRMA
jgi:AbrB family looped-hinge helix DNA binding protein